MNFLAVEWSSWLHIQILFNTFNNFRLSDTLFLSLTLAVSKLSACNIEKLGMGNAPLVFKICGCGRLRRFDESARARTYVDNIASWLATKLELDCRRERCSKLSREWE